MRTFFIDKHKLDIYNSIKYIFKFFPDILKIDLTIKNYPSNFLFTNNTLNHYQMYFSFYLNLEKYNHIFEIDLDSKIKGIEHLINDDGTENSIFDWESFNDPDIEINNSKQQIYLQDINGNSYSFNKFYQNINNLDFIMDNSLIERLFQFEQTKNPALKVYKYSFFRNNETSFINFLGPEIYSNYLKKNITNSIHMNETDIHNKLFKI